MKLTFLSTALLSALFQPLRAQTGVTHIPNYIDSIQETKQITDLISNIDDYYQKLKIGESVTFNEKKCQQISDSLKVQSFTKVDFDQNGLTDLLVVGAWYEHVVCCILDKGDHFELNMLTKGSFQECTFPVVENHKIKYYFEQEPEWGKWKEPRKLTHLMLVYLFGGFIEENPNPANHQIEKIEYATSVCFGECPAFRMTIFADQSAIWKAELYNEINQQPFLGNYKATISSKQYHELMNLLNYIDFEKLQDHYYVRWTDSQSATLTITYNNGQVKSIYDYGMIGTFGLERVHQLLFKLRENQTWTIL